MSNHEDVNTEDRTHLDDIEGSMGCTEIWEKLSEQRTKTKETTDD